MGTSGWNPQLSPDSTHLGTYGNQFFAASIMSKLDSVNYEFDENQFLVTPKYTKTQGTNVGLFGDWVVGTTTTTQGYVFSPVLATVSGNAYGVVINPQFTGGATTKVGLRVQAGILDVASSGTTVTSALLNVTNGTTQSIADFNSTRASGNSRISVNNFGAVNTANSSDIFLSVANSGGSSKGVSLRSSLTNTTANSEISKLDFLGHNSSTTQTSMANLTGDVMTVGKLNVSTGSNNASGTATLSSGTVTVNNTRVTASSLIMVRYLSGTAVSTTSSILTVPTITAGTSFVITALTPGSTTTASTDNNQVQWWIIN
jgi:hypothetical protein